MWRRSLIAVVALVLLAISWAVATLPAYMVGVHQRSVTNSLAEWKTEYSVIETQCDAVRTAEMLGYVQTYYVPADRDRSLSEIETALQAQRRDTVNAFVSALAAYTGENFGNDSAEWLAYLKHDADDDASSQLK